MADLDPRSEQSGRGSPDVSHPILPPLRAVHPPSGKKPERSLSARSFRLARSSGQARQRGVDDAHTAGGMDVHRARLSALHLPGSATDSAEAPKPLLKHTSSGLSDGDAAHTTAVLRQWTLASSSTPSSPPVTLRRSSTARDVLQQTPSGVSPPPRAEKGHTRTSLVRVADLRRSSTEFRKSFILPHAPGTHATVRLRDSERPGELNTFRSSSLMHQTFRVEFDRLFVNKHTVIGVLDCLTVLVVVLLLQVGWDGTEYDANSATLVLSTVASVLVLCTCIAVYDLHSSVNKWYRERISMPALPIW